MATEEADSRLISHFGIIGIKAFDLVEDEAKNGPFGTNFVAEVVDVFPVPQKDDELPFLKDVPMFCQPTGWKVSQTPFEPTHFSLVFTDISGKKTYASCLTFPEKHPYKVIKRHFEVEKTRPSGSTSSTSSSGSAVSFQKKGEISEPPRPKDTDMIYVPKSMVVFSSHPCYSVFRSCLCALYEILQKGSPISFSRWVSFLTQEISLPPPGSLGVKFSIGDTTVTFARTSKHVLPGIDFPLERFFRTLKIDQILQLVASVLYEKKILFVSKHFSQLLLATESLSTLLYPFSIQCVYIPILPYTTIEMVEAPTTFVMGVHQTIFETLDLSVLSDVVVVKLETGEIIHKEPLLSLQGQEAIKLRKAIQDILKPDLVCPDLAFSEEVVTTGTNKKKMEAEIRRAFLGFFAAVLQGYRDYTPLMKLFPTPIFFFQKHAYLHKYAAKKDFLQHFIPTSMFDNFIREDAASVEQTLFSRALEDFKTHSKITLQLEQIVESYHEIQSPLALQESDPGTPPSSGKPLELSLFPPFKELQPRVISWKQETANRGVGNVLFPQLVSFPAPGEQEGTVIENLLMSFLMGKRVVCSNDILDKVFSSTGARAFFAQELYNWFSSKGFPEIKLEEQQFEMFVYIFKKIAFEARGNVEVRLSKFFVRILGAFYYLPKNSEVPCYFYDYWREKRDTAPFFDLSFWEEAFFESVDAQQRMARKGVVADLFNQWNSLSKSEQKQWTDQEDQLIFTQLTIYANAMIRGGVPFSQVSSFLDSMSLATLLSDHLADQLAEVADGMAAREEEKVQQQRGAEDGVKKKTGTRIFKETAFVKELNLPGEQVAHYFEGAVYTIPSDIVYDGKMAITNFRIRYVGSLNESASKPDVNQVPKDITLNISLNSITDLIKTTILTLSKHPFHNQAEGVEVRTHRDVGTFCVDASELSSRELHSILYKLRYPATIDTAIAVIAATASPETKNSQSQSPCHEGVFTTIGKRDCFFDEFNEALDQLIIGGSETKFSASWRVCTGNDKYTLCPSYPRRFIFPASLSDEDIGELAKFHKKKRFPVVSWRSPLNKCVLLRAALTKYPRGNSNQQCLVDEHYCDMLAEASPHEKLVIITEKEPTGLMVDFRNKVSQKALAFNYSNVILEHVDPTIDDYSLAGIHGHAQKFLQALNSSEDHHAENFWSTLADHWLCGISNILEIASKTVALIEGNTSVIVSLEDGWDRTAQVVSLAQLLMDPWYRTIAGFQCLIEKEWLRFGHKFGQRHTQTKADKQSERAPIFLQFMDCVFQLITKFPTDFEFNETFLNVITNEVYDGKFGNFLLNSEAERSQAVLSSKTNSFWTYLNEVHQKSPTFYNFLYLTGSWGTRNDMTGSHRVLYPSCAPSSLKLWESQFCEGLFGPQEPTDAHRNAQCQNILMQYEQLCVLQMGAEDKDSPRKEGRNLWHETWIAVMQAREQRDMSSSFLKNISRDNSVISLKLQDPGLSNEDIVYQGFLIKKGGIVKSWKKRWFVLSGKDQKLYYYSDETKTELRGVVELSGAVLSHGNQSKIHNFRGSGQLDIVTPTRTFFLQAPNASSKTLWVEALKRIIDGKK